MEKARGITKQVAARWPTNVLLGLNANITGGDLKTLEYNSAILVGRSGRVSGRYDKIHRVPFGEYVPFRDILPFMKKLAPYDFDYGVAVGRRYSRLMLETAAQKTYSFGVVICYEDTDPEIARHYGAGLVGTDFLVNISNDGWFNGTSEHEQHLAICRFRAVECRCPVARSVNMGISAVIDGNGRVLRPKTLDLSGHAELEKWREHVAGALFADQKPEIWDCAETMESLPVSEWSQFKKVPGILVATLPLDQRGSFYAENGDWLPWLCWMALAGMLGLAWGRSRSGVTEPAV